ncbi:MAG: hypothetical protein ACRCUS_04755, partial [Anaerovoracaceae bacterium]
SPEIYHNKPILALYNKDIDDCEEHDCKVILDDNFEAVDDYLNGDAISPCGVIPESAIIKKEKYRGKNFITISECIIWSRYAKQIANLIRREKYKNVSVEVDFLDFYIEDGIEYVRKYDFIGIVILGNRYRTGIENAHLETSDYVESDTFKKYKKALFTALDKRGILFKYGFAEGDKKKLAISKDEYGTGSPYKVDKSKESVSHTEWSKVDKIELRDDALKAKNYKTLVNDIYMDVQDGWEDSPSEHLKYPVMQKVDGTFVYNANGLLSAQQYAEKYDKSLADKIYSIRKKLDLAKTEKEAEMDKENMAEETAKKMAEEEEAKKMAEETKRKEEEDKKVEENEKKKFADLYTEHKELQAKYAEVKDECDKLKSNYADIEKKYSDLKMAEVKEFAEDKFSCDKDFSEEEKEEMKKMVEEGKCADKESFAREFAYRKFIKLEAENASKKTNKFSY